jgi:hypothetical protein
MGAGHTPDDGVTVAILQHVRGLARHPCAVRPYGLDVSHRHDQAPVSLDPWRPATRRLALDAAPMTRSRKDAARRPALGAGGRRPARGC